MPTNFGTTPLSTTSLGANQFPVSGAFVPGTTGGNLTAIEGIAVNTDGNSYSSTAVRVGLKDGDDVTLGAKADAASTATDTTAISIMQVLKQISKMVQAPASTPVTGTFWQTTQPVSGTVTANAGTNLNTSALALDTSVNGVLLSQGSTTSGQKGPLLQGAVTTSAPSYTTAQTSPLSLTLAGALRVDGSGVTQPVSGTFWQATQPVSIASLPALPANQSINNAQISGNTMSVDSGTSGSGTQRMIVAGAATGTKSNVAGSATSVTILAANTSRKGAMVYNDSTAILYLDLSGGTASATSYSVQVPANGFFELPGPTIYNGAITGIWASATGNARVTEFS